MRFFSKVLIIGGLIVSGGGVILAGMYLRDDLIRIAEATPVFAPEPTTFKILYYRNPMGGPDTSPVPKKDSMGMDYIPVYEGDPSAKEPESLIPTGERKILYYRNPMGLSDTSKAPKKDSMGMDYIPVYADEDGATGNAGTVSVSLDRVQRAGVRSEPVKLRVLVEPVRAPGTVQLDETKERSITMRTEAFVEAVYAGATGQHVKAGEPLFRIYSPEIVKAQVDYRVAASGIANEGGIRKLRNYGLPDNIIKELAKNKNIPPSFDWPSPVDGVLMRKNIVVGTRVMPGDELYRLADISTMWVIADVAEQDIGRIAVGDHASINVRALAGETFEGKVAFILPELKVETRTGQVRIELPNPKGRLIHQMYADVTIDTGRAAPVLSVPASSIIDSGLRQITLLDLGNGRFMPRPVKLGRRNSDYVEVLEGLAAGDKVVTKANFLIDAESNLQAALSALATSGGQP